MLTISNEDIQTINGIHVSIKGKFDDTFEFNLNNAEALSRMDFSHHHIEDLEPLRNFKPENSSDIKAFIFSHNKIRELPPDLFLRFNFEYFDISFNQIESIDVIINFLDYYPMIKYIKIDHATGTDEDFFDIIQEKCQYVLEIDGKPTSNTKEYENGIILTNLRGCFDFCFHPYKVDMSELKVPLDSVSLSAILSSLEILNVTEVTMPPAAFAHPDAENIFILRLMKTLKRINGAELDRGRIMQAITAKRRDFVEGAPEEIDHKMAILDSIVMKSPENLVEKIEGMKEKAKTVTNYALKFGSFISKSEIFITFQQILMQIINLIGKINWPQIYLNLSWLAWVFTIDWSFLYFIFEIRIPTFLSSISYFFFTIVPFLCITLYYWSSFERVERVISFKSKKRKKRVNILSIVALIIGLIFSWGIGFIFDFNAVIHLKKMTGNWLGWSISFSLITILLFIGWKTFLWYANEKMESYQNIVISKWIKKGVLWLLLVIYAPTVQYFVDILKCDENYQHSAGFDTLTCWKDSHTFTFVHLVSLILCVIYAFVIPIFCIVEIRNGVRSLDEFRHFGQRLMELNLEEENIKRVKKDGTDISGIIYDESTKKELIKDLKEAHKKNAEEFDKEYIAASNDFEHPSLYLFNQFKRRDRFKKVIDLLKKAATMGLTAFVSSALAKNLIASVMYLVLSVYQVIERPLAVFCEDLLESLAQICNLGSLAVGEFLRFDWINRPIFTDIIAPIILIALVSVIVIAFLVIVIMYHTCCGKSKRINSEDNEEREEEEDEEEDLTASISDTEILEELNDLMEEQN